MYAIPRTRVGKWSLGLMSIGTLWLVLLGGLWGFVAARVSTGLEAGPVERGAFTIVSNLVRSTPFMAAVAVASIVLAVIALVRPKDRPSLLYVLAGVNLLLSVLIVVVIPRLG